MHDFRHDVFVKRLGWQLPLMDGQERDEFDNAEAKYLIVSESAERVTACARLLPTTARYMLPELFPQLLGTCPTPRDPAIWELSRFATSVRESREGRILTLSKPTLDLLELVFIFVRQYGVTALILVTSIGIERLMLRAGLSAHRLGPPALVDGSLTVALSIQVPSAQSAEVASDPAIAEGDTEAEMRAEELFTEHHDRESSGAPAVPVAS
jgi:N-acyl-L-homoserine lactone synthetase